MSSAICISRRLDIDFDAFLSPCDLVATRPTHRHLKTIAPGRSNAFPAAAAAAAPQADARLTVSRAPHSRKDSNSIASRVRIFSWSCAPHSRKGAWLLLLPPPPLLAPVSLPPPAPRRVSLVAPTPALPRARTSSPAPRPDVCGRGDACGRWSARRRHGLAQGHRPGRPHRTPCASTMLRPLLAQTGPQIGPWPRTALDEPPRFPSRLLRDATTPRQRAASRVRPAALDSTHGLDGGIQPASAPRGLTAPCPAPATRCQPRHGSTCPSEFAASHLAHPLVLGRNLRVPPLLSLTHLHVLLQQSASSYRRMRHVRAASCVSRALVARRHLTDYAWVPGPRCARSRSCAAT